MPYITDNLFIPRKRNYFIHCLSTYNFVLWLFLYTCVKNAFGLMHAKKYYNIVCYNVQSWLVKKAANCIYKYIFLNSFYYRKMIAFFICFEVLHLY